MSSNDDQIGKSITSLRVIAPKEVWWGGKNKHVSNSKRSYVMNATLSQNVVVIISHEMPPTNNTERVQ